MAIFFVWRAKVIGNVCIIGLNYVRLRTFFPREPNEIRLLGTTVKDNAQALSSVLK